MGLASFQRYRREQKADKYKKIGLKSIKSELTKAGVKFDSKASLDELVALCVEKL